MLKTEEIVDLIFLKQEGEYWDFKRQWYDCGHEGDLLHDIICMANNLANRDAYIIIGVDEENDYAPYDITVDPHRKNTQMIVDFLRSKKFAGELRPVVTVEPVDWSGCLLDVIVVHNSMNTPFYLKQDYNGIHSNNIYVRVQDTNTPKNESADIYHVEYLWKKRFGLHLSPLERMKYLLSEKNNWDSVPGYEEAKYYRYAPEYTIGYSFEDSENRTGYEYFFLNQVDSTPHWTMIQLKYFQTVLYETSGNMLDGGRHFSPSPHRTGVSLNEYYSWDISYCYWEMNSLDYVIHLFYLDRENMEAISSNRRLMENILVFENAEEHAQFKQYIKNNWYDRERYQEAREPYVPDLKGYNLEHFKNEIANIRILQKMLAVFRGEQY